MKKRIQDLLADIEVSWVGGWNGGGGGGGLTQLCIVALKALPSLSEVNLNPALLSGRNTYIRDMQTDAEVTGGWGGGG